MALHALKLVSRLSGQMEGLEGAPTTARSSRVVHRVFSFCVSQEGQRLPLMVILTAGPSWGRPVLIAPAGSPCPAPQRVDVGARRSF